MVQQIQQILNNKSSNSAIIFIRKLENIDTFLINSGYKTLYELIYNIKNHTYPDIPICELDGCSNKKFFNPSTKKYSRGCSKQHSIQITSLERYGVDNPAKSDYVKDKIVKTFDDKYGMHPSQREDEKSKISMRMKMNQDSIMAKKKQTCLEKYGVEHYLSTDESKQKRVKHNMYKYGVRHNLMKGTESRDKRDSTMLDKYGCHYALQNTSIKEKSFKKFNDNHIIFRLKHITNCTPCFDLEEFDGVDIDYDWRCNECHTIFSFKIHNGKNPLCPKCYPQVRSNMEKLFIECITPYVTTVVNNYRKLRDMNNKIKEIDILLDNSLGIELHGNFWHKESRGAYKTYHLEKTILCMQNNIKLLQFFEDEFLFKRDIVMSIVRSKLNATTNKIYARQCTVRLVDETLKNSFLLQNHLQGIDKSTIKLGLFYDDELVSLMTFGSPRFNKKYQYEMHRFCNKLDTIVVGAASKLFKFFIKNYNPSSIITYADRRYSDGGLYYKLNMQFLHTSPPNFYILGSNVLERLSRLNFQKHKLKEKLEKFDENLSAWDNMIANGYDRIWDCGNYVFEWKRGEE